jgi:hypothetical protein
MKNSYGGEFFLRHNFFTLVSLGRYLLLFSLFSSQEIANQLSNPVKPSRTWVAHIPDSYKIWEKIRVETIPSHEHDLVKCL